METTDIEMERDHQSDRNGPQTLDIEAIRSRGGGLAGWNSVRHTVSRRGRKHSPSNFQAEFYVHANPEPADTLRSCDPT